MDIPGDSLSLSLTLSVEPRNICRSGGSISWIHVCEIISRTFYKSTQISDRSRDNRISKQTGESPLKKYNSVSLGFDMEIKEKVRQGGSIACLESNWSMRANVEEVSVFFLVYV